VSAQARLWGAYLFGPKEHIRHSPSAGQFPSEVGELPPAGRAQRAVRLLAAVGAVAGLTTATFAGATSPLPIAQQESARCALPSPTSPGYCGDGGPAETAGLAAPRDVAVLPNGDLLVADGQNSAIRRVAASTDTISTVVGVGIVGDAPPGRPSSVAEVALADPRGVAGLADGSFAIADAGLRAVMLVTPDGLVRTLLGPRQVTRPVDVAQLGDGSLAVADAATGRVIDVNVQTGADRTLATGLASPWQIVADPTTPGGLILSETKAAPQVIGKHLRRGDVLRIPPGGGAPTVIAGPGAAGPAGRLRFQRVAGVAVRSDGVVLVADRHVVYAIHPTGAVAQIATGLGQAEGIGVNGTELVIADSANNRIVHVPAFLPSELASCAECAAAPPTPASCDGCTSTPATTTTATTPALTAPPFGPPGLPGLPGPAGHKGAPARPKPKPKPKPKPRPSRPAQTPGAAPPCGRPGNITRGVMVEGVARGRIYVVFPLAGWLQIKLAHTPTSPTERQIYKQDLPASAGRVVQALPRTRGTWWVRLRAEGGCIQTRQTL